MSAETQIQAPLPPAELMREPLVTNNRNVAWVSDQVAAIIEGKTPKWWWAAFIPSFLNGRAPSAACKTHPVQELHFDWPPIAGTHESDQGGEVQRR